MSSSSTILPVLVLIFFIYLTSEEFTWSMAMCPFSTTAKQYEISPPYWAVCRSNHSDFHGGKKLLWCRVSRCIFSLFPKIVCAKWIYSTQKPLNMVYSSHMAHMWVSMCRQRDYPLEAFIAYLKMTCSGWGHGFTYWIRTYRCSISACVGNKEKTNVHMHLVPLLKITGRKH